MGSIPGWEDPLAKEMVIHSSILAWKIPWTEEPGRLHPWRPKESDTTEQLNTYQKERNDRVQLSSAQSLGCVRRFATP